MTKNQKVIIGGAIVVAAAYALWKSSKNKNFVGFAVPTGLVKKCCGHTKVTTLNGNDVYSCCNGKDVAPASAGIDCKDAAKLSACVGASKGITPSAEA